MSDNSIEKKLPELQIFLMELLKQQYSEDIIKKIIEGFTVSRKVTIRVNTIKSDVNKVKAMLLENKIKFSEVHWSKNALVIENARESDIQTLDIYENGEIYLQSLSSMLPPIILNPHPEEDILDMCAAPRRKNHTNSCVN